MNRQAVRAGVDPVAEDNRVPRRFLFLQGVASPFFRRLARSLVKRNHKVTQVSFNGGDALFWLGFGGQHYREGLKALDSFIEGILTDNDITDVVAFGDCRPVHLSAVALAKAQGLSLHLFEEGYIRPGWITHEQMGVNGYTSLPRNAGAYSASGEETRSPVPEAPPEGLGVRGVYDVAYHIANFVLSGYFHGYSNHRLYRAYQEYSGWARRHSRWLDKRRRQSRLQSLLASNASYYLFPLQLDGDTQITVHSNYDWVSEVIRDVLESFARHASADALLMIKRHPLDTGHVNHANQIEIGSCELGIADRVHYFEGGSLESLVSSARGVVMVNSTIGMMALQMGRPLMALGNAVYKVTGLTHPGTLDDFWKDPMPPDIQLFRRFRQRLIEQTQIRGNYYTKAGMNMALPTVIARLEGRG